MKHILSHFIFLLSVLNLASCDSSDTLKNETKKSSFPTTFTIEIPNALSRTASLKDGTSNDYSGKEAYNHLNNFIHVGILASEFIEDIMVTISQHNLEEPISLSFINEDDDKKKNLQVTQQVEFQGKIWQNLVTVTDANSEKVALKVYWDSNPIKGIALLQPSSWDTHSINEYGQTIYRVDYSEAGDNGYEKDMTVSISAWEEMKHDRFHMNNMKMFVGKKGEIVDVFGNLNHPNSYLLLEDKKGFSWAFVASASTTKNISVAEIGLPLNSVDSDDRTTLLKENSIRNAVNDQVQSYYLKNNGTYLNNNKLQEYLEDTEAPGYFHENGFIQAGISPNFEYSLLEARIQELSPYNPKAISELNLSID